MFIFQGCCNKMPQLTWLKTTKMYFLTEKYVCQKSKINALAGLILSWRTRKSVPCLLSLVVLSNPWCSLGLWQHNSNLCLCCHKAFSLCFWVSVFHFSLLIRIPIILKSGPTLIQHDLNYTCKIPLPNKVRHSQVTGESESLFNPIHAFIKKCTTCKHIWVL